MGTSSPLLGASTAVRDLYEAYKRGGAGRPLIEVDTLLPPDLGPWPVSRVMAGWLALLIHQLQRRSVLEFGAGWSSLVLAKSLEAVGGGQLTSIEHEPQFIRPDLWTRVEHAAAVDTRLIVAPLQRRLSTHGFLWSYAGVSRRLAQRGPYDLVFIDAPPGRYGRSSPLHDAYPFLAPGAIVVLDDATRSEEQTIARRWVATYPGLDLAVLDTRMGRGFAVLVHDGNKGRRLAPRALAGSFRDEWRRRAAFRNEGPS
jgi:predicted O-methyltransferase YrrM